ncbi:MAG: thiol:disulfide interchange protein DsbA/DsbL [Fluviicoccus sp.]|uniref:thiol:disulfide interchange protein DsbA/DsbL n=1 Tax=Fluviicoccus sp. TaxID=2003552 RepID=UPI00271938C7|nr:thiol:disulfide interchange protein DsbA/DsbL [Fluviicoccus sp.]MDO8331042.1 thiol:disulfide interchange protein DsbA/DsbL [Fluviicoccus sp.]
MKKWMAVVMLWLAVPMLALAATFVEGKDYRRLATPGPVDKPGMVEVREFFWYGCPHCFRLEPFVSTWLKTKPSNVNFIRTPAALNPVWEGSARGFYTLELMGAGLVDKTHGPLFSAIHETPARIFDENALANFYSRYGVDPAKFRSLFNSFAVTGKVMQSKSLAQKFQLEGVPAVVVNGKYVVSGESAKVLEVVNYLIGLERKKK